MSPGCKQNRLNSYLQALLASGLTVLPYDRDAALWHGAQRARGGSSGGRLRVFDAAHRRTPFLAWVRVMGSVATVSYNHLRW